LVLAVLVVRQELLLLMVLMVRLGVLQLLELAMDTSKPLVEVAVHFPVAMLPADLEVEAEEPVVLVRLVVILLRLVDSLEVILTGIGRLITDLTL
jgi:hypothetical protein